MARGSGRNRRFSRFFRDRSSVRPKSLEGARRCSAAWAEITGQIQMAKSQVFTFYLDENGKVTAVR